MGGIFLLLIGMIFVFLAAFFFFLYRDFEKGGGEIGKATASLTQVKCKKNVRTKTTVIKNYSTGTYEYTVNGKTYKIRYESAVTARQMPYIVPVIYFKKIPRLALVRKHDAINDFFIYAILSAFFAVMMIFGGFLLMI